MAVLAQARDLPQAQLPFEKAHRLIMQIIAHPAPVELGAAMYEALLIDPTALAFAIGQDIEAVLDHAAEQLRTPPAAVKDDGHPALADCGAHLSEQGGKGFGQGGVDLCGDRQQRIAPAVVDPVVGGGGHGQMAPRHVGFGDRVLPVIGAYMAIDVQEPHQIAALSDAQARQFRSQLFGVMMGGEARELAPQRLDLGRPIKPEDSAEGRRVALFELLGPLDTQQRHEQQRQQRGAQAVEGRTDFTVELASDPSSSTVYQIGQSQ